MISGYASACNPNFCTIIPNFPYALVQIIQSQNRVADPDFNLRSDMDPVFIMRLDPGRKRKSLQIKLFFQFLMTKVILDYYSINYIDLLI